MSEIQQRLKVMVGKWNARAAELEAEAEEMANAEHADRMTLVINSKYTRAGMYRACANEVTKEAGIGF